MLKDTDKYESSAHFSHSDYKRKQKNAPNKDVMIFTSVFVIGVLIILGFAKILSPNVDVGIHVEDEISSSSSVDDYDDIDDNGASSAVDDRLQRLKLEDEGKREGDEQIFSPELDEKVVLPHQVKKTVGQIEAEMASEAAQKQKTKEQTTQHEQKPTQMEHPQASRPEQTETKTTHKHAAPTPTPSSDNVNARVVVGYYATEKQAEVAKSIIQDAGLNVTPIVKNLGNCYTLQVGSYSSREKAQQAANTLLKSNFPARIIVD